MTTDGEAVLWGLCVGLVIVAGAVLLWWLWVGAEQAGAGA